MNIYLLILVIYFILLIWLAYRFEYSCPASPSVSFIGGFLISAVVCLVNTRYWHVEIHFATFSILVIGVTLFSLVSYLTLSFMSNRIYFPKHFVRSWFTTTLQSSNIITVRMVALCIVSIFILVAQLYGIHTHYAKESLSESIAAYRYANTFSTDRFYFPFPVSILRNMILSSGYYISYLVIRQARQFSRNTIPTIILFCIIIVISITTGGRTACFGYIFISISSYIILNFRHGQDIFKDSKSIACICFIALLVLVTFRYLAIGRTTNNTLYDYLSIYLGSEIRNLDYFVNTPTKHHIDLWGGMTFIRSYNYLGVKFDLQDWIYPLDLPYLQANGHSTGNVYTTFYAFLYDFGIVGVIVLTTIMAAISSSVYYIVHNTPNENCIMFEFITPIYCFILFQLSLSFFSNKFYENFLSITFLRSLIYYFLIFVFINTTSGWQVRGTRLKR